MSTKRKKNRKFHRSSEVSSLNSSSESSSDEETDARDLKSIKEYIFNRKELAAQIFKSVKTDKIRMMLPQILKKIDLKDLEELCTNELSGMSKKRILAIINAQQMLESSDTNDSDSDPSLEIISDTEEWLSDDVNRKSTNSKSTKQKMQKKFDPKKTKVKSEPKEKVKIKVEEEKEAKDKEGDSLLDLLELEMRARAIRALIRKEEGIIPTTSDGQSSSVPNTKELDKKICMVKQRVINELSSQQLENIMKQTEEEDVVLVVQPTTIIELLSTDDEAENQNEQEKEHENVTEKSKQEKSNEKRKQEKSNEKSKPEKSNEKSKPEKQTENRKFEKEAEKTLSTKFKKINKQSHRKLKQKLNEEVLKKEDKETKNKNEKQASCVINNDMEEIIDLDDYPNDMDDIDEECAEKTSTETWASRYYKTDDVQSVIKESKIQSEIRKRLRERQRLGKISNSPTNSEKIPSEAQVPNEEFNPIGSVQEYLALKATLLTDNNDSQNSSLTAEKNLNDKNSSPENSLSKNTEPILSTEQSSSKIAETNISTEQSSSKIAEPNISTEKSSSKVAEPNISTEKSSSKVAEPNLSTVETENMKKEEEKVT